MYTFFLSLSHALTLIIFPCKIIFFLTLHHSLTHAHEHAHAHTRSHSHTHTRTHTHTHTHFFTFCLKIFSHFLCPSRSLNSYLHQSFVHRQCFYNKPKSFLVSFSFLCTEKNIHETMYFEQSIFCNYRLTIFGCLDQNLLDL